MEALRERRSAGTAKHRQRGATALEFAFVFPVFFMLFYATVHFGLVFTARMSLQHAAEEGARAALRWHPPAEQAGGSPPGQGNGDEPACVATTLVEGLSPDLSNRLERSLSHTCDRLAWITRFASPIISVGLCLVDDAACSGSSGGSEAPACGTEADTQCQLVVTVRYPYGEPGAAFLPAIPGFGILAPAELRGQARIVLDGRML